MEIRLRSQVSRNAKGYSVEATLDIGATSDDLVDPGVTSAYIDGLSEYQVAKLREHMEKLGAAFPKEEVTEEEA